MGRKWTYCAVYSIIQIQFFRGVWEEIFNAEEATYAPPGSDVNLTCQTKEKGFLVQMQWSKVTDKTDPIVVYHPQYGFRCVLGHTCESQVASIETQKNVTKWTLHLRNVSTTFSGKYECSFTVYPDGIQTTVHSLIVAPVIQDEHNRTIETEMNRTLEIPCFQNTSSEISPGFTFAWLVKKDGVQEDLFTHNDHISNSTSFKVRVKLRADSGLHLSPVQIQDDGKTFSCHLAVNPLEVWKTSTTVKVFGIYIMNDEENDRNGFQELKSVLTRIHGNRPAQPNNVTIQCKALSPGPRNKMWNTSSQVITLSLDSVNISMEYPASVMGSTLGTQPFPDYSVSPTRSPAISSMTIGDGNVTIPDAAPQAVSLLPSEMNTSAPSEASLAPHDSITSTTKELPDVPTTARGIAKDDHSHITNITVSKPRDGMSWPVVVAALLSFCTIFFGLGVRKWCQYQKEIMERPPPFKPPPPPIKYMCIQEPSGHALPCPELEAL